MALHTIVTEFYWNLTFANDEFAKFENCPEQSPKYMYKHQVKYGIFILELYKDKE